MDADRDMWRNQTMSINALISSLSTHYQSELWYNIIWDNVCTDNSDIFYDIFIFKIWC